MSGYVKEDELQENMIVYYNYQDNKIIRINKKSIIIQNEKGEEVKVLKKSGWNFKIKPSDTPFMQFIYKRDLNMANERASRLLKYNKDLENEIKAMRKIEKFPMWVKVRDGCYTCNKDYLEKVLKAVQPYAERLSISFDRCGDNGNNISLIIKKQSFHCTVEYLKGLLKSIIPVCDTITLDYGRN